MTSTLLQKGFYLRFGGQLLLTSPLGFLSFSRGVNHPDTWGIHSNAGSLRQAYAIFQLI